MDKGYVGREDGTSNVDDMDDLGNVRDMMIIFAFPQTQVYRRAGVIIFVVNELDYIH
jgi:hypothetical protein